MAFMVQPGVICTNRWLMYLTPANRGSSSDLAKGMSSSRSQRAFYVVAARFQHDTQPGVHVDGAGIDLTPSRMPEGSQDKRKVFPPSVASPPARSSSCEAAAAASLVSSVTFVVANEIKLTEGANLCQSWGELASRSLDHYCRLSPGWINDYHEYAVCSIKRTT